MKTCPTCKTAEIEDSAFQCATCAAKPPTGLGGLYVAPQAPKKKGKFSETLWFKEGDELKDDDLEPDVAPDKYAREGQTPEDVRKKFSLNPDKPVTDDDILP